MDSKHNIPKVVVITLTNNGYIDYTLNCTRSLKISGFQENLKIFAIGRRAYNAFRIRGFDVTRIKDKKSENFEKFRKGNWANVTYYKFVIIRESLKKYDYVLYTDGDVVFKKDKIIDYCLGKIGDKDLLIQNDLLDDNQDENLCSGFMFIRSNGRTRGFFDPDKVKSEIRVGWDDQLYINEEKQRLRYLKLPLSKFPNGRYFRYYKHKIDPYIVHFNWVVGHRKAYRILSAKEYKSYYLFLRFLYLSRNMFWNRRNAIFRLFKRKLSLSRISNRSSWHSSRSPTPPSRSPS